MWVITIEDATGNDMLADRWPTVHGPFETYGAADGWIVQSGLSQRDDLSVNVAELLPATAEAVAQNWAAVEEPPVWPQHNHDDGTWCRWSSVSHKTAGIRCPDNCEASNA